MTFLFTALVCIFGVSATSGEVSLGDDWYPMGEEGDATAASGRILSNGTNSTPTTPTPAPAPLAVGGVACYENWQCGYFQAGWDLLLSQDFPSKDFSQINGECKNGACECAAGFTCGNCAVTEGQQKPRCCKLKPHSGNTYSELYCNGNCAVEPADPTFKALCEQNCECSFDFSQSDSCVNLCTNQWGGGACERDEQCLNGGKCIGSETIASGYQGTCSCVFGYSCAHCELPVNDLNAPFTMPNGEKKYLACPGSVAASAEANSSYVSGGARCKTSGDCSNSGTCEPPESSISCASAPVGQECTCKCSPNVGCGNCAHSTVDILSGAQTCGCDTVKCPAASGGVLENANGQCNPSTGSCDCYWPYTGADCSVNPCKRPIIGDPCKDVDNSVCVVDEVTQQAKCECTDGWSGADCKVEPACQSNADCGVWAPIPEAAGDGLDPNFACSETNLCVEDKYGGTCVAGKCTCNSGFACNGTCTARGDATLTVGPGSCSLGTGGGKCTAHTQCQRLGKKNYCFEGRCVCSNGFTCPLCDFAQQGLGLNQTCPVPPEDIDKYSQIPGPEPTPSPTPDFEACGANSMNIAAQGLIWYKGNAARLCICRTGFYADGATIPSATLGTKSYPNIPGNKPYKEMFKGVGSIACKKCPSEYLRASCLDENQANWKLADNESAPSFGGPDGLSGGAMAGIVIGAIAGVGILGIAAMSMMGSRVNRGSYKAGGAARSVQMSGRGFGPRGVL